MSTNYVWKLEWSENAVHGEHFSGYTDYTQFVVIAPDETTARNLAQAEAGESIFGIGDGWTNTHWTTCERVDMSATQIVGYCQGTG